MRLSSDIGAPERADEFIQSLIDLNKGELADKMTLLGDCGKGMGTCKIEAISYCKQVRCAACPERPT